MKMKKMKIAQDLQEIRMEKELKYEQAMRELEAIVRKMENNELDIDMLGAELKRAQTLIKICKDKLTKADNEVKNVLKNCEE